MAQVTVYYVPQCGYSAATSAFLLTRGVSFELVNLDRTREKRGELQARLKVNKLTTPVVESGELLQMAPPLTRLKELSDQWLNTGSSGEGPSGFGGGDGGGSGELTLAGASSDDH